MPGRPRRHRRRIAGLTAARYGRRTGSTPRQRFRAKALHRSGSRVLRAHGSVHGAAPHHARRERVYHDIFKAVCHMRHRFRSRADSALERAGQSVPQRRRVAQGRIWNNFRRAAEHCARPALYVRHPPRRI